MHNSARMTRQRRTLSPTSPSSQSVAAARGHTPVARFYFSNSQAPEGPKPDKHQAATLQYAPRSPGLERQIATNLGKARELQKMFVGSPSVHALSTDQARAQTVLRKRPVPCRDCS